MTTLFIYESSCTNIPPDTDACYEEVARQEEIYLENNEEELRMILESDDQLPSPGESPNQQREEAAEELITGDSDDPPLSEEAVERMLQR